MEDDTDEEELEYFKLDNERERHWRVFLNGNDGGVHDKKAFLYAKVWDVYVN